MTHHRGGADDEQAPKISAPCFEMPPRRVFPPVDSCCGVRPSQAANCRPDRNCPGSVTVAASAVAVITPIPGIAASLWLASFPACQVASSRSSAPISSFSSIRRRIRTSSAVRGVRRKPVGIGEDVLGELGQIGNSWIGNQPELRQMRAERIRGHGALTHEERPGPVGHEDRLLLDRFHRNEAHRRPLHSFADGLRVKGTVRNKAVYVALAVRPDGTKEVLGLWIEQSEGAKFWLRVMNELKGRGVEDVLIAVVDGLKGFPEAITAVFPQAQVQTCVVHLIRHSLAFVSYKDRKGVAAALKQIYKAKDADAGEAALEAFDEGTWDSKYPAIAQSWRRNWAEVIPFFAFPDDVRRIIYTTNSIESLNAKLRRAVRTRGHFPTDDSALKLLFLVLNLAEREWKMAPREWVMAKAQFAILFEDRFTLA